MNNINFFLNEDNNEPINNDISNILKEFEDQSYSLDTSFSDVYYNFLPLKEIIKICKFYGLEKGTKGFKKDDYIKLLVAFETTPENIEYVEKRQRLWTYMSELKNDPVMKNYIIWD